MSTVWTYFISYTQASSLFKPSLSRGWAQLLERTAAQKSAISFASVPWDKSGICESFSFTMEKNESDCIWLIPRTVQTPCNLSQTKMQLCFWRCFAMVLNSAIKYLSFSGISVSELTLVTSNKPISSLSDKQLSFFLCLYIEQQHIEAQEQSHSDRFQVYNFFAFSHSRFRSHYCNNKNRTRENIWESSLCLNKSYCIALSDSHATWWEKRALGLATWTAFLFLSACSMSVQMFCPLPAGWCTSSWLCRFQSCSI